LYDNDEIFEWFPKMSFNQYEIIRTLMSMSIGYRPSCHFVLKVLLQNATVKQWWAQPCCHSPSPRCSLTGSSNSSTWPSCTVWKH
jgi:hypothetical protein